MTASIAGPGFDGSRCRATDDLGNRCHKSASHASGALAELRHDATRGDLQRQWL